MSAMTRRTVIAVGAAACLLGAVALVAGLRPLFTRPGAVTLATRIVDSSGKPLRDLFEGLPADPRGDPALVLLMNRDRTAGCRATLFGRLLSFVERTAYAQGSCQATACQGQYGYLAPLSCDCGSDIKYNSVAFNSPNNPGVGWQYDGNVGCTSCIGDNIPTPCTIVTCNNGWTPPPVCNTAGDCASEGFPGDNCCQGQCIANSCVSPSQYCCTDGDCPSGQSCSGNCCTCGGAQPCGSNNYWCTLFGPPGSTCLGNGCCGQPPPTDCSAICGSAGFCSDPGQPSYDNECDPNTYPYCGATSPDGGICYCCSTSYDPIIIDVKGDGYSLTSDGNGVKFDMAGNGKQEQIAWTSAGSDDAFLTLDRNGNGRIDNGTELFSNFTSQPQPGKGSTKNGWAALAVYDQPENGGNGDGWIDAHDAIYPKLLLWVDRNHNGKSEPNELFGLAQLGVERISLNYTLNKWVDAYGNAFRYQAAVVHQNPYPGENNWAYDVMLQAQE